MDEPLKLLLTILTMVKPLEHTRMKKNRRYGFLDRSLNNNEGIQWRSMNNNFMNENIDIEDYQEESD